MPAHDATSWSASADQLLEKLAANRWVPLAINLAAMVLLIYGLAQWTWRVLRPAAPPTTTLSRPPDFAQTSVDLQPLFAANLFGRAAGPATAKDINPAQLPLTSLNLILTGVMALGKSSFALLSIDGAQEVPIVIGQEITAGALLESVYSDRIVIRRGASLEGVLLKDSNAVLPDGSILSGSAVNRVSPVRQLSTNVYGVNRKALEKNLTVDTLRQASTSPSANGLVVRDVQTNGMFEDMGLQTGDVVRSINGQPVSSLDDVAKIYGQLAITPQDTPIAVEVVRGGRTEVLQYQMQ